MKKTKKMKTKYYIYKVFCLDSRFSEKIQISGRFGFRKSEDSELAGVDLAKIVYSDNTKGKVKKIPEFIFPTERVSNDAFIFLPLHEDEIRSLMFSYERERLRIIASKGNKTKNHTRK